MISESDFDLLDAYLDEALSPGEVERLVARLSDEPDLAEALAALRNERTLRHGAFASVEPTEAQANRFAANLVRDLRREERMVRFRRFSRNTGTVAASLLIGLGGGWWMRGTPAPHANNPMSETETRIASSQNPSASPDGAGVYQVALTDAQGRVLAVQKFNRRDEAEHFANDLGQVEARQQNVQDGNISLISDHF